MSSSSGYLMGHSDHERRRLALQAAILKPLTQAFLSRAGLSAGMRVLDLGCGVGDVTFIAARLVGTQGHVTGLDCDKQALEVARASLSEAESSYISFQEGQVAEHSPDQPYDAIIGRHILIHTPNPLGVLQQAVSQVRPGGILAFQEFDLSRSYPCTPTKPLFEEQFRLLIRLFTQVAQADIGMRLFQLFREAGLTNVESQGEFLLDGGAGSPFYEWLAETVRSVLPKLEALGICTSEGLAIETLRERLKHEAVAVGGSVTSPILVGTYGRRP